MAQRNAFRLILRNEHGLERDLLVPADCTGLLIGRGRQCDICLEDPAVSERHLRITSDERRVYLEDLGSSNGTFLSGERVVAHAVRPMRPGQQWRLGRATLQLDPAHGQLMQIAVTESSTELESLYPRALRRELSRESEEGAREEAPRASDEPLPEGPSPRSSPMPVHVGLSLGPAVLIALGLGLMALALW